MLGSADTDGGVGEAPTEAGGVGWLRLAAWGSLIVTEGAVVSTAFALIGSGLPWRFLLTSYPVTNAWLAGTFAPFGTLVALRRPRLLLGWFFCGFSLCYGLSAAALAFPIWQATSGGPNHWTSVVGWLGLSIWEPAVAVFFPLMVLLFPHGRLVGRPVRWLAGVAATEGLLWCAASALSATTRPLAPFIKYPPVTLPKGLGDAIQSVSSFANSAPNWTAVVCVAVMFWRWHGATGTQRAQLSWLLVGALVAIGLFVPTGAGVDTVWSTALLIGVPAFPIAASIAVLRHHLLGIDFVISRTLVYLLLTAVLLGGFLAVVGVAGLIAGHNPGLGGSLPAAAVVAFAFAPVRQFLQRRVDTMLFGYRRDPSQALRQVAIQLRSSTDDELAASLRAVSESLHLPDLILVTEGQRMASRVEPSGATSIPLQFGSQQVGELLVQPRRGQAALDARDLAALELVAVPVAAAVHSMRLGEQLQRSRQQLIDAQAEERRRLHRELHDGLGPALTAVALRADAAGNISLTDSAKARALILELADQTRQAIEEVRRLAHNVGPLSVEKLGLFEALRRQASIFVSRLDGGALVVTTELPETIPPIPVEVRNAAFRIATEALTNIARHSNATSAVIRVEADTSLTLQIIDDGSCDAAAWREGFGLASMRERAAAAGGALEAGPTPGGGRVHVRFPLHSPAAVAAP